MREGERRGEESSGGGGGGSENPENKGETRSMTSIFSC